MHDILVLIKRLFAEFKSTVVSGYKYNKNVTVSLHKNIKVSFYQSNIYYINEINICLFYKRLIIFI